MEFQNFLVTDQKLYLSIWKATESDNALAYYGVELITTVKSFIEQVLSIPVVLQALLTFKE